MQISAATVAPRPWTILGYADCTPSDIGPDEQREILSLKDFNMPNAHVVMQLQNLSKQSHITGALTRLAIGGALCLAGSMTALPLLFPLGVSTLFMGGMKLFRAMDVPTGWDGQRTVDLSSKPGEAVTVNESKTEPSNERLVDFLVSNMQAYPSNRTALYLSGHGLAFHEVSGRSVDEWEETLRDATARAGRKLDLVIMDACLMGNLEAMRKIAPYARYAVASEETVGARGLPLADVLSKIPATPGDDLGPALVEAVKWDSLVPTLSCVDLSKIEPLAQAVESMASVLKADHADRAAIKEAIYVDEKYAMGLRDLGQTLSRLESGVTDAAARAAVAHAQALLKEAVVSNWAERKYQPMASGLTIQGPSIGFRPGRYSENTGMTEWSGLLQSLRPWPIRAFTWLTSKIGL